MNDKKHEIKICGVNDAAFAVEAERLGADYLGFVFAETSPRLVTASFVVATRRRLRGTARCVGVFTDAPVSEMIVKARVSGLEIVQLHRKASVREVSELRECGFEVWTLAGGAEGDAVVFDSSHGDGETALRGCSCRRVLAGGISAANVAGALGSGADVIDISGSLESSCGVKSIERLKAFFDAVEFAKRKEGNKC